MPDMQPVLAAGTGRAGRSVCSGVIRSSSAVPLVRAGGFQMTRVAGAVMVPIAVVAATLTAVAVAGPAPARQAAFTGKVTTVPLACRRHVHQSFLADASSGEPAPLHLVAGRTLRLRFPGQRWSRWTRPTTSRPGVVAVGAVVRCPHGTVVAFVHARQAGRSRVQATLRPFSPEPPATEWSAAMIVSARPTPAPPVPGVARLISGGGVLAYPSRLVFAGAIEMFTVPQAVCATGRAARATIGMFGVKRTTTPAGHTSTAAWSAGVSIACTGTTRATYTARYATPGKAPVRKTLVPGDWVLIGVSGADCPSLSFYWGTPGSDMGQDGIDDGCVSGPGGRNHVQTAPTLLFGARARGRLARPLRIPLRDVAINATPLRMTPHTYRVLSSRAGATVTAHRVPSSWYRLALKIR